ncbi:hypothetical protein [Rhodopseudomonas palustris]
MDAFERIDTLMLEVRHIQETVSSHLGVAEFYQPLELEDRYLWGRYSTNSDTDGIDWWPILPNLSSLKNGCETLSQLWCLEFPGANLASIDADSLVDDEAITKIYGSWSDCNEVKKVSASLIKKRRHISERNLLSAIDERLYESLRYLQLLKRDSVRDKLVLACRGWQAFHQTACVTSDSIAEFLLVRRVVLFMLHQRLEAFRDVQSCVQEILNLSLERDPIPTVRRRRDQGIYTTDLADLCRFISIDLAQYFNFLNGIEDDYGYVRLDEEIEYLVHRYTGYFTSVARTEVVKDGVEDATHIRAGFIRSSFWMPERPDLQPIIAHEVAHLLINKHFDNLTPTSLDRRYDAFSRLLRQLSHILECYASQFQFFELSWRRREDLGLECAVDMASIAVHGTSYLFAHFLELVGAGCEDLFEVSGSDSSFRSASEIHVEQITAMRGQIPEWYLRLSVARAFGAALTEELRHSESKLDNVVLEGARDLVEFTANKLLEWMDGDQREDWRLWLEMCRVIEEMIASSDLGPQTNEWRTKRGKHDEYWRREKIAPLHRHTQTLDNIVSSACVGMWFDRLLKQPRMLGNYLCSNPLTNSMDPRREISILFGQLYLGATHFVKASELRMFQRLIDIPWQCAVLTARDLLGTPISEEHGTPRQYWMTAFHEFGWLGRDLYHYALEFVIWFERSPVVRLKAVLRWLDELLEEIKPYLATADDDRLARALHDMINLAITNEAASESDGELRDLIDEWPKNSSEVIDRVAGIRAGWLCREHTDCNFPDSIRAQRYRHVLEFAATHKLSEIGSKLEAGVRNVVTSNDRRPIELRDKILIRDPVARAFNDVIQVIHYLAVRPEINVRAGVVRHHPASQTWAEVFSKFLDVPTQARKRAGGDYRVIPGLIAARSFNIDRISLDYFEHEMGENASFRLGHDPENCWKEGRKLLAKPWGRDGCTAPSGTDGREYYGQALSSTLLGRFDRFVLEEGRRTSRTGSPVSRRGEELFTVPFFRRQQRGIPFACTFANESVGRLEEFEASQSPYPTIRDPNVSVESQRVPIATINVLLTQRSARLTFIERLLAEDIVMNSFDSDLRRSIALQGHVSDDRLIASPYRHFHSQGDIGLLTDGWGDCFLVLFCNLNPVVVKDGHRASDIFSAYLKVVSEIRQRFEQVVDLRRYIFRDPLVVRSETSYTPIAMDVALLNPEDYQTSISFRFKSSLDGMSPPERFEAHMRKQLKVEELDALFSLTRVSGRLDYAISTKSVTKASAEDIYANLFNSAMSSSGGIAEGRYFRYGVLYEMVRNRMFHTDSASNGIGKFIDSTRTSVSEIAS